jgi:hypothetical protein
MSAQDDLVKDNLDVLRDMHLARMNPEEYLAWQSKIDDINDRYLAARAVENDEKASAEDRKRAKDVADGIAKAVPAMTKSLISAVKFFSKGDAVNGTAEIMDICASLAPLISTFLSATGPEGMLVGALFSVVAQILRCFGPTSDSDVAKLEKFLLELEAQSELKDIKAVHDAVLVYASTLVEQGAILRGLMAKPLHTDAEFWALRDGVKASLVVLGDNNPHSSVAMFEQWKVLEYLQQPEKQDQALWPTVLGVCCKTYSDLVSSTMMITAMTHSDDLDARLAEITAKSVGDLPPGLAQELTLKLHDLKAYGQARKVEYESCNAHMLSAIEDLAGVAKRWGLHACIADNFALKFLTGPAKVKGGSWTDVSDRNYYHRLVVAPDRSTVIVKGQVSAQFNFKPAYHCFVLKSTSAAYPGSKHWVDHLWVHADTATVDNVSMVLEDFPTPFTDISVAGQTDKGLDVYAGTAEGTGAPGSVTGWGLSAKNGFNNNPLERVDWWPQTTSAVGSIAAVTAPVAALGDPDGKALPPGWADRLVYASMRDSTQIYVNFGNQDHYLSGPAGWGPCHGITVDDTYLWLYQPYGFAVVSHASVLGHLHGALPAPRWLLYPLLPSSLLGEDLGRGDGAHHFLYNGWPTDSKPSLLGLISLSPCADGTLLAAVVHRTIWAHQVDDHMQYDVDDTYTVQTADYEVDILKGSVTTGSWTAIPGGALQVQKVPMPGWNLLANLTADLSARLA